jgi:hypothetical protein
MNASAVPSGMETSQETSAKIYEPWYGVFIPLLDVKKHFYFS